MGRESSLRTLDPRDVERYLLRYHVIATDWWEQALQRRESKDEFQRFIGKRATLDRFFAKVDREAAKLFPGAKVLLAYGSAGNTMKPCGNSEVAVPTSTTFKAAQRIFKDRLHVTSEIFTTKMDWRSGTQKAAVYRIPAHPHDDKLTALATTLEKTMPKVLPEHEGAVQGFFEERKQRAKTARRAIVGGDGDGGDDEDGRPTQPDRFEPFQKRGRHKELRYPEVQAALLPRCQRHLTGLRFVHESGIHQNRDLCSSQTISRLCVLEISKGQRPSVFCFQRRARSSTPKLEKRTMPKKAIPIMPL